MENRLASIRAGIRDSHTAPPRQRRRHLALRAKSVAPGLIVAGLLSRSVSEPEVIEPPEYPGYFEIRKVSHCGAIRLKCHQRFVSNALKDKFVGLKEIDDGMWNIVYYTTLLGRIDEHDGKITGVQSVGNLPGLLSVEDLSDRSCCYPPSWLKRAAMASFGEITSWTWTSSLYSRHGANLVSKSFVSVASHTL